MKHFTKKIVLLFTICCLTFFYACQNDEHYHNDEIESHNSGMKLMSVSDVMALLKQQKIKNSVLETTQPKILNRGVFGFEGEEERQFEVLDMGDYINYSLYLDEYTEETPYYHFLVVTVNSRDSTEQAAYLRYRPEYPLEPFNAKRFTGRLEIYDIENEMQAVADMVDGRVNMGIVATEVCTTTTWITEVPCSHSGQHGIGQSCNPGYINDAYIQINISTTCRTNYSIPPSMVGGYSGGGGGGGGTSYIQGFYNSLLPLTGPVTAGTQKQFYNANSNAFNHYLNTGGSYNFAKHLIDRGLAGRETEVLAFLNAWKTTSAMKIEYFKIYMSQNQYSPQSMDFVMWGTMYYKDNPTVTVDKFRKQFMGKSEGPDPYHDAAYWDNPNLTFPPQPLPSWTNFEAAYPKSMYGPDVYQYVGGPLYTWHLQDVTNRSNACALRVSRALNYSGITIPAVNGTFKGADNKNYFLSARTLNKWLRKTFGTSGANYKHITSVQAGTNGGNVPGLLSNLKGIYSLVSSDPTWASGHADILFDNGICDKDCHYQDAPISYIDLWILQ